MAKKEPTEKQLDIRKGIRLSDDSYDETGRFIRPANCRQDRPKRKRTSRKVVLPGNPDLALPLPELDD